MITLEHKIAFDRDGFVVVPDAFDEGEVQVLADEDAVSGRIRDARAMADAEGRNSKLSLTRDFSDDVWGYVSRMPRVVRSAEILLGEAVYHWHSKIHGQRSPGGRSLGGRSLGGRSLGMAPGLRLLVPRRPALSADDIGGTGSVIWGNQFLERRWVTLFESGKAQGPIGVD